jgi:hypothetical protein
MEPKPIISGESLVNAFVQADTTLAPYVYWGVTTIAVLIGCVGPAFLFLDRPANESLSDTVVLSALLAVAAVLLYLIAWGWRLLFTRRKDHLFGKAKYTSDRFEPTRAKWASLLSILSLGV